MTNTLKQILKEMTLLLGLAVLAAFVVNALSPKGIALFGDWDTSKGVITAKPKDDVVSHDLEIKETSTAKDLYDNGAVFVDARTQEDYLEGRIKGALSLPVWQFEAHINRFKDEVPDFFTIVTYCSGRECDDSHLLAQRLMDEGYTDVRVFIDGYPQWVKQGYPVEH